MLVSVVALLTVVGGGLPATAGTGGTPDGEDHPQVALIAYYTAAGRMRCSATLVSPTVLLTAAHCTQGTVGRTLVTFDSVIATRPPLPLPIAAMPTSGYSTAELAAAGFLSGTAYAHPGFAGFGDKANLNDVGVVVLDAPVSGITPAELAPIGTLDTIAQSQLRHTLFTAVGYGSEVRKPTTGPQKPRPFTYPLIRRFVDEPGQQVAVQTLQTNGNEHDVFGTGGTCVGDSGGPVFYQGQIVAVVSYGKVDTCRYLDGHQRVDIAATRDWLADFGL